jgi:hypothetical protein
MGSLIKELDEIGGRGRTVAEFIAYCTWGKKAFWYTMGIKGNMDSGGL